MSELWLEVTLPVPAKELDGVCDVLTANGMTGLVVEEEGDFLKFLKENRQYWDYVDEDLAARMKGASRVKFYVPDSEEGQRQLREYLTGLEQYEPQTVSLREEDWATSWQKYYQPIPVGKRVYIVPEWMRGQDIPEGRVPLYLNPGLTFGTGSHPTTQLCLELLEEVVSGGEMALDLGCGSGILAIAALRLGVASVVGVDIDPKAEDIARENAGYREGTQVSRIRDISPDSRNLSGTRGVYLNTKTGKYRVRIKFKGVTYNLGTFSSLEAAIKERARAEEEIFGKYLDACQENEAENGNNQHDFS